MAGDDSVWEAGEVAAALEHYLALDGMAVEALEERLRAAGVLERVPVRKDADEAARFQVLALATQDLWLADRFCSRSSDAEHFGRLRAQFFAALRTIGEHGAALESAGLVILDPARPWIAPLLAEALASAPVHVDAQGPMLVMMRRDES
ncbi:MAG TPA: hypothetical protein VK420_13820 [Longimicrobium sp.]|nr:hypothetical protein [Longimicrobium sp.]